MYFCELNRAEWEHASVNRSLLRLVAGAFPGEAITCWLDKRHWLAMDAVSALDEPNNSPSYVRVMTPERGNKMRWMSKLLRECGQAFRLLRKARKERVRLVFFASVSPVTAWWVSWLAHYGFREVKVVMTLHGELQLLRRKNEKWIDRWYARCLKNSFARQSVNVRFLLLGEHIQAAVFRHDYLKPWQVIAIPHPLTLSITETVSEQQPEVVFGHIGVAKLAKRSQLFFELAKTIHSKRPEAPVSFVLAGAVLDEMKPWENEWVVRGGSGGFLAAKPYRQLCERMTYAIFCYTDEEYELISSGAIMDAIALEIPMIALRNDYFDDLFSRCPEPPGIVCEHVDALYATVAAIVRGEGPDYTQMKKGVQALKRTFSNDRIQEKAAVLLKEFVTL